MTNPDGESSGQQQQLCDNSYVVIELPLLLDNNSSNSNNVVIDLPLLVDSNSSNNSPRGDSRRNGDSSKEAAEQQQQQIYTEWSKCCIYRVPSKHRSVSSKVAAKQQQQIYTEWSKCCIYRVPSKLRSVNEAAYTPQVVSIGPFHHANPKLIPMKALKSSYLGAFCRRTGKTKDDLVCLIRTPEPEGMEKIRACYASTCVSYIDDNELADMVVTDAGFIIELFLRKRDHDGQGEEDYILRKPWLRFAVEQDLILLENQIPFRALVCIFNFALPCHSPRKFLQLSRNYFSAKLRQVQPENLSEDPEPKHFTDLLTFDFWSRISVASPGKESSKESRRLEGLRSATKLTEAGVEFKTDNDIGFQTGRCLRYCPCCDCSWLTNCLSCFFHCFPALKCEQATLTLPLLEVDHTTECVFRNLMALEQCHYPDRAYVCNYVSLMDKLINTREDVELLMDKKVIANFLGSSKAVAELFNRLCQHVVEENTCFYHCVQQINTHCNNPLNRIMATLTSVYFRDFWRGTATVVGIIVLALTVWNIFLRHILKTKWY